MPVAAVAGRDEVLALCGEAGGNRVAFTGGTYSAHPASLLAARTMMTYLRDHEAEVYPRLASLGDAKRRAITEGFAGEGVEVHCSGGFDEAGIGGSLTGIHFPHDERVQTRQAARAARPRAQRRASSATRSCTWPCCSRTSTCSTAAAPRALRTPKRTWSASGRPAQPRRGASGPTCDGRRAMTEPPPSYPAVERVLQLLPELGGTWCRIAGAADDRPPVLLLHGGPGYNSEYLRPFESPRRDGTSRRPLRPDRRGPFARRRRVLRAGGDVLHRPVPARARRLARGARPA